MALMRFRVGWWLLVALDLVLLGGWVLLAAAISGEQSSGTWAALALFPLTLAIVTLAAAVLLGWRGTGYASLTAIVIGCVLYQVHAGFRVAYLEGDIPNDTLIYNTTSPDVNRLARDLAQLSLLTYGDASLPIQVEVCNSLEWPFHWYLREMDNVSYLGTIPDTPDRRAPVIIGSLPEWSSGKCAMPSSLPGYTAQQLVLRWHENEWAVYRNFAIAPELDPGWSAWISDSQPHGPVDVLDSVLDSFGWALNPAGQEKLFRLLMYRQTGAQMAAFSFNVYIRNDLMPLYNDLRYSEEP